MKKGEKWEFGCIEFHGNEKLRERFYAVVQDLQDAGCIVDLWVNDIKLVLEEFGYTVDIRKPVKKEKNV